MSNDTIEKVWKIIGPNIKSDMRVLEVGVGDGKMTKELSMACRFNLSGLDYNTEMLEKQDTLLVEKIHLDIDFDKEPIVKFKEFDVIVCCEVLEHLRYPEYALKLLYNSLKKGGLLIVSTPNGSFYTHRLSLLAGKSPEDWTNTNHYHNWNVYQFRKLIENSDFVVKEHTGICWFDYGGSKQLMWTERQKENNWMVSYPSNFWTADQIIIARKK